MFDKGVSKLREFQSISVNGSWAETELVIGDKTYMGDDFIVSFPPVGVEFRKDKIEDQKSILEHLINKNIALYTLENFDVNLSGRITEVNKDDIKFLDSDGEQTINIDQVEYIAFSEDTAEFITKDHVSFFTKVVMKWSNRKEFKYIY